jgi:hypothetical protein
MYRSRQCIPLHFHVPNLLVCDIVIGRERNIERGGRESEREREREMNS